MKQIARIVLIVAIGMSMNCRAAVYDNDLHKAVMEYDAEKVRELLKDKKNHDLINTLTYGGLGDTLVRIAVNNAEQMRERITNPENKWMSDVTENDRRITNSCEIEKMLLSINLFAALEKNCLNLPKALLRKYPDLIDATNEKNETVQTVIVTKLAETKKDLAFIEWDMPDCTTTKNLQRKVKEYKELESYIQEIKK